MDEEKLIILVQGHECLYNLQHNDYDNNLVKKIIPGRRQHENVRVVAGRWQGRGRFTAWYV
jgi:hypothetical protein